MTRIASICAYTAIIASLATVATAAGVYTKNERRNTVECTALFDALYLHHSDVFIFEQLELDPYAEQMFAVATEGTDEAKRAELAALRQDVRFQTLKDVKDAENGVTDPDAFIKRIHDCNDLIKQLEERGILEQTNG